MKNLKRKFESAGAHQDGSSIPLLICPTEIAVGGTTAAPALTSAALRVTIVTATPKTGAVATGTGLVSRDAAGRRSYEMRLEYKFFDRYNWDGGKSVTLFGVTV